MSNPNSSLRPNVFLGLDVGGTKIEAIAVDPMLTTLSRATIETNTHSPGRTVDSIIEAIDSVLSQAQAEPGSVSAVGVGIPGQVSQGIVKLAVNLGMESYPLQEALSGRFPFPIVLENDVRAATLGAYRYLKAHAAAKNIAYLSIGTGISAGLMLNGELYRGSNGMAGEIGHIVVEPRGPRCNCGAFGCLEALAAGPAIANRAIEAVRSGEPTLLSGYPSITAESVFEAARRDDDLAKKVIQQSSKYLGTAIHGMVMAYDVDRVVLGGGVTHAGETFLNPLLDELARLRAQSELSAAMLQAEKVMVLPDDYNAGVWGAIALAQRSLHTIQLERKPPEQEHSVNKGSV